MYTCNRHFTEANDDGIFETIKLIVDSKSRTFDRAALARELDVGCDSVGWMRLDVAKDMDKLKLISEQAKKEGLKLRGVYEKKLWIPRQNGIVFLQRTSLP